MRIKRLTDVPGAQPPGYADVTKRIVLGADDGSDEIVLRHFSVAVGGTTPYHQHDFPHLVKIESGQGVALDGDKRENPVAAGDFLFVASNELHGFTNTGAVPLEFLCIVPARGEEPVDARQ
jgi:quercetin dioxygenase-like cupin family protein